MVEPLESVIARFRRRWVGLAALVSGVRYLAWWCWLWGTLLVTLRAGLGVSGSAWWWGSIGLLPVLALAMVTAWRSRPPRRAVRALLDRHNQKGGLVMAADEVDLAAWADRVGEVAAPQLRVYPPWGLLAAGVVFVAAAAWVPATSAELEGARALAIGEEITELAGRIKTLEDEALLDEEQATSFESTLQQLADESSGDDPASAWATLDHLQEMMDRTADEVAETALAEGEQLASIAALAEALAGQSEAGTAAGGGLAEAVAELSTLTARAASESRLLDRSAVAEMSAAGANLTEMSAALGRGMGGLDAKLERLQAGGALDLAELLRAREALESGSQSLSRFLEENDLEATGNYLSRRSGRPGRGGVDRGRGDAPMNWLQASSAEGARFREQILDASAMAQLGDHGLIGLSAADPTVPSAGLEVSAASGVDPNRVNDGGMAATQTLLPRHRGAVRRYFDRSDPAIQPATQPVVQQTSTENP